MENANKKRGRGGWYFLAGVVLLYVITAIIEPETIGEALPFAVDIFQKVVPVLFLVFLLLLLGDLFLNPALVKRYLGEGTGMRGWLLAMVGGVLSTGPIYAWYPFLLELRHKGMRNALIIVFLYSRAVKLPLLPLMIHYFGWLFTLMLSLYLLLFSIINGLLFEKLKPNSNNP
jgi:uncharacterized membrane protein YraQ (UPF0718 family)